MYSDWKDELCKPKNLKKKTWKAREKSLKKWGDKQKRFSLISGRKIEILSWILKFGSLHSEMLEKHWSLSPKLGKKGQIPPLGDALHIHIGCICLAFPPECTEQLDGWKVDQRRIILSKGWRPSFGSDSWWSLISPWWHLTDFSHIRHRLHRMCTTAKPNAIKLLSPPSHLKAVHWWYTLILAFGIDCG